MQSIRFNPRLFFSLMLLCVFTVAAWIFLTKDKDIPMEGEVGGIFESMNQNELIVSGFSGDQIKININDQTSFVVIDNFGEETVIEKEYLLNETLPNGISVIGIDFKGSVAGKILITMPAQVISGIVISVGDNTLILKEANEGEFKIKVSPTVVVSYTDSDGLSMLSDLSVIKVGDLVIVREQIIEKGEIIATLIDLRSISEIEGDE